MKKIVLILNVILATTCVFAQSKNVGINTEDPQETLHVKGTMRFQPIVTSTNPAAASGKTLTSDASGNATWKTVSLPINHAITASYGAGTNITQKGGGLTNAFYTGTSITLPPGTWIVSFAMDMNVTMENGNAMPNNKAVWIRSSLFDSTATEVYTASSADILDLPLISKDITGPATNAMMIGEFTVKNSGTTSKTYYYKASVENSNFSDSETSKLNLFGRGPESSPTNRLIATIAKYPAQ